MFPPQAHPATLQLQARDLSLLIDLFEARVMTTRQIAALFFDCRREYTKKRLQKLKAAGLLSERRRRMNEPSVLLLTKEGFKLLKNGNHLSGYPPLGTHAFEERAKVSELTLRHELEIMDVKAAFHVALSRSPRYSISEFSTWPLLSEFRARRSGFDMQEVLVRPDGFLGILENGPGQSSARHDCFLEVDRSTETQDTLAARVGCYLDYYRSGGFAVRNGGLASEFKDFPFRLLIVLKSAARRNNTAERLLQMNPPVLTLAWLTTFEEVKTNPLGPIWIQPKGYREATQGTPYDPVLSCSSSRNRQLPQREAFVESDIKKLCLLDR